MTMLCQRSLKACGKATRSLSCMLSPYSSNRCPNVYQLSAKLRSSNLRSERSHSVSFSSTATSDGVVTSSTQAASAVHSPKASQRIVFVIGGPGSGKGTQCEKLVKDFQVAFFSAGELIRSHIKSGSPEGKKIQDIIMDGRIIPSEITVGLLQQAMAACHQSTVLIDGFPRNMENIEVFRRLAGRDCDVALFFDCPLEVLQQRLSGRNQGREDDNEETIRKRVNNFQEQTAPVLAHYKQRGTLQVIRGDRSIEQVYQEVKPLFAAAV